MADLRVLRSFNFEQAAISTISNAAISLAGKGTFKWRDTLVAGVAAGVSSSMGNNPNVNNPSKNLDSAKIFDMKGFSTRFGANLQSSLSAAVISESVQSLVYSDDFDFTGVATQSLGNAIGNSMFATAEEQMLEHIEQQNGGDRAEAERIYQQNYADRVVSGEDAKFPMEDDLDHILYAQLGIEPGNMIDTGAASMLGGPAGTQFNDKMRGELAYPQDRFETTAHRGDDGVVYAYTGPEGSGIDNTNSLINGELQAKLDDVDKIINGASTTDLNALMADTQTLFNEKPWFYNQQQADVAQITTFEQTENMALLAGRINDGVDPLFTSLGSIQNTIDIMADALDKHSFSGIGGMTRIPDTPQPYAQIRVSTDVNDITRPSSKALEGVANEASSLLRGSAELLQKAGRVGGIISAASFGADSYAYYETGDTKYLGSAMNTVASAGIDLAADALIGMVAVSSWPAAAIAGIAYTGLQVYDSSDPEHGVDGWLKNEVFTPLAEKGPEKFYQENVREPLRNKTLEMIKARIIHE